MNKQDYERYKELDRQHNRNRGITTWEDQIWYDKAYDRLSPQQKGAIHRFWKEREHENYIADAGGYY